MRFPFQLPKFTITELFLFIWYTFPWLRWLLPTPIRLKQIEAPHKDPTGIENTTIKTSFHEIKTFYPVKTFKESFEEHLLNYATTEELNAEKGMIKKMV